MFKKTHKILFSLLFVFSSVFSMDHSVKIYDAVKIDQQIPPVTPLRSQGWLLSNSSGLLEQVQQNGKTEYTGYLSMQPIQCGSIVQGASVPATSELQIQSLSDITDLKNTKQKAQAAQHLGQIVTRGIVEHTNKVSLAKEVSQLASDIVELSTRIQTSAFQPMKNYASWSNRDLQIERERLSGNLPQLETELQNLIDRNGQIDAIVNPEKYGLGPESISSNAISKDAAKIKEAVGLKKEIESRKSDIRAIDNELKRGKCDFANELKNAQNALDKKIAQEAQFAQEQQQAQPLQQEQAHEIVSLPNQPEILCNEQLRNQYETLNLDSDCCPDSVQHDRQMALSQTEADGYASYEQQYLLSPQAAAFLQNHDIAYSQVHNFNGTALQQELHSEYCKIVELAAEKQAQLPYQSDLLKQCLLCADAAYDANRLGQIQTVISLNNLGFTLLEYSRSVVVGALKGCENTAYAITHPEEVIESVGKGVYYVLETVVANHYIGSDECRIQFRNQRNAEIIQALQNLGSAIANSTGPQRVQALAQFGTEFLVPGKTLKAVAGVMGAAELATVKQLGVMQAQTQAEKIKQAIVAVAGESKGSQKLGTNFASAAQKVKIAIAQEKIVQNVAERCKKLTFTETIQKVQKCGGKISAGNIGLRYNAEYWVEQAVAQVNTKIDAALLEQYNKMTQIAGNAEMSACMDLEHIVNIKGKLILDKSKSFYSVDWKGGHLAGTMFKLEQEGLVKIESFVEFGSGCREYQVKDLLTGQVFTHTEFPAHWTVEKIAQETKIAVENAMANGSLTEAINKPVYAKTNDSFKLIIITDSVPKVHNCITIENTINRHIVTAYPIYEKKL